MQTIANFLEKETFELKQVPMPSIGEGEILLKILSSGICGTDIKIFSGNKNAPRLENGDAVLGHEFVGEIVELSDSVKGYEKGQTVFVEPDIYCDQCEYCKVGATNMCEDPKVIFEDYPGAFSQYLAVPAKAVQNKQVHIIPENMSTEAASLIEPLACVIHGQARMRKMLPLQNRALVLGGGPIGCMHALVAKSYGYTDIIIADVNKNRIIMLEETLGSIDNISFQLLNPNADLAEFDNVESFNLIVQACPVVSALSNGFTKLTKAGGIIAFAGIAKGEIAQFEAHPLHYQDLHVIGSANYVDEDIKSAIDLLKTNEIPGELLVSKSYPLDNIQEAMEYAQSGNALKIVLKPNLS